QQHRDPVSYRKAPPAGGAGQILGVGVVRKSLLQRGMVGAGACEDLQQLRLKVSGHVPSQSRPCETQRLPRQRRTTPSTSSRNAAMASVLAASTLSRSNGSVFDGRRLNQAPSASSTVSPSSSSI